MKKTFFNEIGKFVNKKIINKNSQKETLHNFESNIDLFNEIDIDSKDVTNNKAHSDKIYKNVKMLKINSIEIDPEFSKTFSISTDVLEKIKKSIELNGYDNSQPIVIWESDGKNLLIDGHTRRQAALEVGILEIPAFIMRFDSREDAHFYTFKRQVERRNLSAKELLKAVELSPKKVKHDGTGRSDEKLAKELGVSTSTITHTRAVLKYANEEQKESISKGEKSINKVLKEINENKEKIESTKYESNCSNSIENIIVLLLFNKEISAIKLIKDKLGHNLPKEIYEKYFIEIDTKEDNFDKI